MPLQWRHLRFTVQRRWSPKEDGRRDAGELTIFGELRGEDVKITFAATAEEWGRVAELFEDGDCDAVDESRRR